MHDDYSPAELVYVQSTSAASLPPGDATAPENNLAGMMKSGVVLIIEPIEAKMATERELHKGSEARRGSL